MRHVRATAVLPVSDDRRQPNEGISGDIQRDEAQEIFDEIVREHTSTTRTRLNHWMVKPPYEPIVLRDAEGGEFQAIAEAVGPIG